MSNTAVNTSVTVDAAIAHCFTVFTEGMHDWWDHDHHLIDNFERMEVEPRVGGRILDHATDGSTSSWARVLVYDPPTHFAFSWDISLAWQVETDPARTSEVHVTFTDIGGNRTRVDLEHRHLDRHGDGWEAMRDAVGSENGWNLSRYGSVAAATLPL